MIPTSVVYVVTVLVWGVSWITIYYQLPVVPVTVSVFYRFAFSALILLPLLLLTRRLQRTSLKDHGFLVLQGACLFSCNFICFYTAIKYIPSGVAAVVFSLAAVFNAVNSRVFWGEAIEVKVLLGSVLGVLGLACIFSGDLSFSWSAEKWLGLGLATVGTALFSFGNMISIRNSRKGLQPLTCSAYALAYGSCIVVLILLVSQQPLVWDSSFSYIASLVYLVLFSTIVGFIAYLTLVDRIGPGRAGYSTVIYPVIALIMSSLVEGYVWTIMTVVGLVLVIGGNVVIMTWPFSGSGVFKQNKGHL